MKSSACNRMKNIQLSKTENITEKLIIVKTCVRENINQSYSDRQIFLPSNLSYNVLQESDGSPVTEDTSTLKSPVMS